ncbi:MAG: RpiB/LacA/LacB family sugar-phosphate isomerase [Lachnospiraceae bacterium]|nr:RpiB/LacA/LacB family sugar-phosphate isomerase [Lachnospiraceae bacterium]
MKIALINENSQAAKNALVESCLRKVAEPMGHTVYNYGMYAADDACQLTYVKAGLLAAILINAKAADYVVTGCGTGEGAMLACNIYPNVLCGHLEDVEDAFMFAQINDGNAIALPFAKKFGWGGELTLTYMFEKLLGTPSGGGYPPERVEPEQRNKKILDEMKKITHKDMMTILREVDQDFLRETISGEHFAELFYPNCQVPEIAEYLKSL